ncbi:MAG: phosphate propanoyltransferase [Ruminococcus sp.]|jgi:putative phosphotransacetylase|nr:phosphate propanoyltransferase [Ruminococcus sp.]
MSKEFIVETSARHIHLTKEDFETLFGAGKTLTPKKELSQPGQYACEERVEVLGPKKSIPNISILGPFRNASQVELSMTDARSIGIAAPVRESGDTAGSAGCTVIGPAGKIELKEGVIVAKRHVHLTVSDAAELGVKDKDIVWVRLNTAERSAILGDVVIRVSDSFSRAMHIDTDEANAVGSGKDQMGTIIDIK